MVLSSLLPMGSCFTTKSARNASARPVADDDDDDAAEDEDEAAKSERVTRVLPATAASVKSSLQKNRAVCVRKKARQESKQNETIAFYQQQQRSMVLLLPVHVILGSGSSLRRAILARRHEARRLPALQTAHRVEIARREPAGERAVETRATSKVHQRLPQHSEM